MINVLNFSGKDKIPTSYPLVPVDVTTDSYTPVTDIYMTTDFHSQVPDIHTTTDFHSEIPDNDMTTDFHSPVPDIHMTKGTDFSVGTISSSPVAYPEHLTTDHEGVTGEFVTQGPWATTVVPPTSFIPTVKETITEDWIAVATVQPDLGEARRDNVSIGEFYLLKGKNTRTT